MDLKTQEIIFNNNLLHRYLREHSIWYKILNRNPTSINEMLQEMKDTYKLNTSDKIENFKDKLNMIESFLDIIK